MNCIVFSQAFTPIVQQIGDKQHFCFNTKQSKEFAKLLIRSTYNDSLISRYISENIRLRFLVQNKEQTILYQNVQLQNNRIILANTEVRKGLLQQKIESKDQKIKRSRTHKIFLGAALLLSTTLFILK